MSAPNKKPVETPGEWLRYANENLRVAEYALTLPEPAWHTICFLCQSAAEKFLKAYLVAQGWKLQKTHDIVVLLRFCSDFDNAFAGLLQDGAILNEYITAGRYPGDLTFEDIGSDEAQEAVAITQQIADYVVASVSASHPQQMPPEQR